MLKHPIWEYIFSYLKYDKVLHLSSNDHFRLHYISKTDVKKDFPLINSKTNKWPKLFFALPLLEGGSHL